MVRCGGASQVRWVHRRNGGAVVVQVKALARAWRAWLEPEGCGVLTAVGTGAEQCEANDPCEGNVAEPNTHHEQRAAAAVVPCRSSSFAFLIKSKEHEATPTVA